MKYFFMFFGFFFCTHLLYATEKPPIIDSLINIYDDESILNHSIVLKWKKSKSSVAFREIVQAKADDFELNTVKQEINFGYNQPFAWSKFSILNKSSKKSIIVKIQQSRVDSVQLFIIKNDSLVQYPALSKNQAIYHRNIQSNDFVYEILIQKNELITCFLYSYRQYGHHADVIEISDKQSFTNNEKYFNFAFAIIIGLVLFVALLGLAIYLFTKSKPYLYYSLYSLSYILLFLADSGFIHSYFELPRFQFQINYATTIMFYVALAFHTLFTIELFELSSLPKQKWFYSIGIYSVYLFMLAAFTLFFIPISFDLRWHLVFDSYFILFFVDVYILVAILICLNKNLPITYFYLVGFVLTLIIGTTLVLANIGILDGINQNTNIYYFTPLFEILVMVLGFGYSFSKNIKDRFSMQEKLNKSQQEIIETQENERKRIGQDLHDDVGNTLAAINTRLKNKYPTDIQTHDIVANAITNVRLISHNLMPVDFSKYSLNDVLEQTLRKLDNKLVKVQYINAGDKWEITQEISLEIYRIFNEIINNLYRHANASEATVQLIYRPDSFILSIEDNGTGFDLDKVLLETEGIGLQNMRSRANLIGAKLTIQSDQKGTLSILDLPKQND